MGLIRTSDAATEPVTLAEAKAHARVDVSDDDALITAMITAARHVAEQQLQRALITQTWKLTLDEFPSGVLELPHPALQSVTSVKYYDADGVQQTLSNTLYRVDTSSEPGRIEPVDSWPATYSRIGAVEVIFVAGWANAAAVPAAIKSWMLMRVASMYEHRADQATQRDAVTAVEFADCLLDPWRVWPV